MTRKAVLISLTFLLVVGAACERRGEAQKDAIREAILASEALSRQFEYTQEIDGRTLVVRGVIEDDLAYRVEVLVDGQVLLEEAVVDDARAVRLGDANALSTLGISAAGDEAVLQALQGGAWVVDPTGSGLTPPEQGSSRDVITEALTALRALSDALAAAREARVFNPEAIDYRPEEDPFRRPDLDNGEIRYDLLAPRVPPRQDPRTAQPGEPPPFPGPEHFRKMAVYIRDGRVVELGEVIDPSELLQEIFIRLQDAGISLSQDVSEQLQPREADPATIRLLIGTLNEVRQQSGLEPIRLRSMKLVLRGLDSDTPVVLPPEAVEASLRGVLDRGQVLQQSEN